MNHTNYDEYLNLFYEEMDKINSNKKKKKLISLCNPTIKYSDNKKVTKIINILDICKNFKRDEENFISFIKKEISQERCYTNPENQLLIYQYLTFNSFKKLMVNYCKRFITCKSCQNNDTVIERDNILKKNYVLCNFCNHKEYL